MRYIDEFRNQKLIKALSRGIEDAVPEGDVNIMEVCGTHTQNFFRFGLSKLVPKSLHLISGPGCPVCVSSQEYIDKAIAYAKDKDNVLLTFGDMLRVPGTRSTLEIERAKGADIRIVYSPLDAIKTAQNNPRKRIIFLAVGFETTAPTIALSVLSAKKQKLNNVFFLSSLKTMPSAMGYLLKDPRLNIDAFLCPGHVSAIIGTAPYGFIPKKYRIGCCICGFEPLDILEGLYILVRQIKENRPVVANQYARAVKATGNPKARRAISQVFSPCDTIWRGLGIIPGSGLKLKKELNRFDIEKILPLKLKIEKQSPKNKNCRCAEVLKGVITPRDCPLFKKVCSPDNPYGPCMVSIEGACNAYYKYQ